MDLSLRTVSQGYHYVFDSLSDYRTKNWWLVQSPVPIFTILASYLFFCNYAGPQYMRNRKPYKLKNIIALYNIAQIILNTYLMYRLTEFIITIDYKFQCVDLDYTDNQKAVRGAAHIWWYLIVKIMELIDTVFFVLRKKDNQLSFLHLYHHTIMVIHPWFILKYYAGGQCIIDGGFNSIIHIPMYGYYFLSSLGPQYQKYLWWKKHLTTLQLIQFTLIACLNTGCLFSQKSNHPKYLNVITIANCFAFFYMFGMFYYKSYMNLSKGSKQT